jgi:hypothetical protein
MRDRPIIFSALMVQALLAGQKTQTRRLSSSPLRRVQPGDRLWVRENWRPVHSNDPTRGAQYRADIGGDQTVWRHSIHMPRWASRITLLVTDVRVQRLQEINRGDAMAEGCPFPNMAEGPSPTDWFRDLWDQLHGNGAWNTNPEIVAATFTVQRRNIDA